MVRVNRNSIETTAAHSSGFLQALLVTVVALLAQCLVVAWIPKQFVVALMRNDVIDYICHHCVPLCLVHHTQRVLLQEASAVLLPPVSVATPSC